MTTTQHDWQPIGHTARNDRIDQCTKCQCRRIRYVRGKQRPWYEYMTADGRDLLQGPPCQPVANPVPLRRSWMTASEVA